MAFLTLYTEVEGDGLCGHFVSFGCMAMLVAAAGWYLTCAIVTLRVLFVVANCVFCWIGFVILPRMSCFHKEKRKKKLKMKMKMNKTKKKDFQL